MNQNNVIPLNLINRIVDFISNLPFLQTNVGRQSFVYSASIEQKLVSQILFDGTTIDFAQQLINKCISYDDSNENQNSLLSILEAIKPRVGKEGQDYTLTLINEIRSLNKLSQEDKIAIRKELFLQELGIRKDTTNSIYHNISDLYVEPSDFHDKTLNLINNHNIVFILGDPHIGKTFTAVYLLWHFYLEGYKPIWLSTSQIVKTFETSTYGYDNLIDKYFDEKRAIYLEDPFGRTTPIDIQEFVANLHQLIIHSKDNKIKVIITSRTNIFNIAVKEKFAKYVITLSQHLTLEKSYSEDDFIKIINKYCKFFKVKWSNDAKADFYVKKIVKELHAPHNITLFLKATKNIENPEEAFEFIEDYNDVVAEFAKEMISLSQWHKFFLYCIYFFSDYDIHSTYTQQIFIEGISTLNLSDVPTNAWEVALNRLNSFITVHDTFSHEFYSFRHPSLEEGFDLCVEEDIILQNNIKTLILLFFKNKKADIRLAAFKSFLHFSTYFGNSDWARQHFKQFLNSSDIRIRELARRYITLEFDNLHSEFKTDTLKHATQNWNERNLAKLVCSVSYKSQEISEIVKNLLETWDTWVKDKLTINLMNFTNDIDLLIYIAKKLMNDDNNFIRRESAKNLLSIGLVQLKFSWKLIDLVYDCISSNFDQYLKNDILNILSEYKRTIDLNENEKRFLEFEKKLEQTSA